MNAAKPVLVIAGVAVGIVGLGAFVFAALFQWAAECRTPSPQ